MRNLMHTFKTWRFSAIDTDSGAGVLRLCLAINVAAPRGHPQRWIFKIRMEPAPDAPPPFHSQGNIKCSALSDDASWIVPPFDLILALTENGDCQLFFGLLAQNGDSSGVQADEGPTLDPGLADELRRLLDDLGDETGT